MLYEVITRTRQNHAGMSASGAMPGYDSGEIEVGEDVAADEQKGLVQSLAGQRDGSRCPVITSYSIHYTKLYDMPPTPSIGRIASDRTMMPMPPSQ